MKIITLLPINSITNKCLHGTTKKFVSQEKRLCEKDVKVSE